MCVISVVIPVRDEEKNIDELVERLGNSLGAISPDYEVIFVTDVNRDSTYEAICEKNRLDRRIKVIKLSNSFGQHVAILSGLHNCSGDQAVLMDGDLQDCPEDIPEFYHKIKEGFDVVYGVKQRKNDSLFRNQSSRLFNRIMSVFSDVRMDYNTSLFRILSRRAIDELCRFTEIEPSLTYIFGYINLPTTTIEIASGQRKAGNTKYSFLRLVNFAISSLVSFSRKPLRLISQLGILTALLGFLYLVVVLFQYITVGVAITGWATLVFLLLLIGGIQLISIGVLGEYIGRIYLQTKNRPLYIVDQKVGSFSRQANGHEVS